MKNYVIFYHYW